MSLKNNVLTLVCCTLAVAAMAGTAAFAQQPATTPSEPTLNLQLPIDKSRDALFSSSSDTNATAIAENHFDFTNFNKTQPPPRRYGRPRYRGSNQNADGSNKWTGIVGAGFTQPVYDTGGTVIPSWGFQLGVGPQFSHQLAVPIEFNWDNFGFNGQTIANQSYIYFGGQGFGLDGHTHIWSFSVNPTVTVYNREGLGAYVVGGVGFYHKVADFTIPATGRYCDIFGFCYSFTANQVFDHYTSNAPGFNGGLGITYKFSKFSSEKLYAEARYVYINNPYRPGYTAATINSAPLTATNFFPQNSLHTTYIPVKVGIRF
jgi:hypothetical protein